MQRLIWLGAPVAAALAVGSSALASPRSVSATSQCKPGPAITQTQQSAHYSFVLDVGPMEAMYTPAQVKTKHPKTGEVMLGGAAMSMGHGMAMGSQRHLEVHICSRASGAVVKGVMPSISLVDEGGKSMKPEMVPVAVMEGIGAGPSDLHYGNNVGLVMGHRYAVTVVLKGEKVVFRFKA